MKEPGPEALGAQPWFCLPRDRVSFLTLSRNDLQAAASNITTGPRPASFVSRTPMRPGRSSATSTQLPLQALWELLRHAGRMDAVLTGASSLPPPRPPAAARPLYSRFPALTPVAPISPDNGRPAFGRPSQPKGVRLPPQQVTGPAGSLLTTSPVHCARRAPFPARTTPKTADSPHAMARCGLSRSAILVVRPWPHKTHALVSHYDFRDSMSHA